MSRWLPSLFFLLMAATAFAYGTVNGPATLRGTLNDRAVALRYDAGQAGPWTADLELASGTNTLKVCAEHPSEKFTNDATSTFTLTNKAADKLEATFDGNGNITQRLWRNATNGTARTQSLTWDAFNRLVKVTERDTQKYGYNWQTVFDGLGRRARTLITLVSNDVATATNTLVHYYDPQVEFLEVGVSVNGVTVWKLYGPDGDGQYGSQQGFGGLELLIAGTGQTTGIIQDHLGNVLAGANGGAVQWVSARSTSYGPVEGTQLPTLSVTTLTVEHLAWRGKWCDVTGDFYWGARPYRPERGAFLSFDPFGHGATPGGYAAYNNDPVNYFDFDARLGKALSGQMTREELYGSDLYRLLERDFWQSGSAPYFQDVGIESRFSSWLGGVLSDDYSPTGIGSGLAQGGPSFGAGAAYFAGEFVNASLLQQSWHELRHPDFSSGWGWGTYGVAAVGLVAGTVDAAANVATLGGKGMLEGGVKAGLKDALGVGAKEAVQAAGKVSPVVIGENMKRINKYARDVGGYTIDDWLVGRQWSQKLNDEFIKTMKAQGREFIDIGPDFERRIVNRINPTRGRSPSSVYGGERQQLLNYDNYQRVYDRTGKYEGGVH